MRLYGHASTGAGCICIKPDSQFLGAAINSQSNRRMCSFIRLLSSLPAMSRSYAGWWALSGSPLAPHTIPYCWERQPARASVIRDLVQRQMHRVPSYLARSATHCRWKLQGRCEVSEHGTYRHELSYAMNKITAKTWLRKFQERIQCVLISDGSLSILSN